MPIAKDKIFLAFILPFIFWVYLAFSSQMTIAFDSIGFENDGKIIKTEGLKGYLKNTPQKEPLYACSIALSMKLADALRVDYKKIQTGFQILLLLLGQFLLFRLLRLLELNPDVIMAALLYYGFSPGLISCGFDLYSEIITLPFILLSIILITKIWRFSLEEDRKSTTLYALFFALTATTATFSKAVLTVVYPLFVLPFVIILIQSFLKKRNKRAQCVLIFMVVFFSLFNISIHHYKSLNKKYHGHYTFTDDRGISMLYTIAFKRTTPLTQTDLGLAVTSIPGINVCRKFYGQICEERLYDSFALAHAKMNELASDNIPKEKIDRILISSSIKQILSHPFSYSLFTFLESLKMFFWESTKIGFVSYPPWLTKIHDNVIIKNSLRLFMALMTLFSFTYVAVFIFKERRKICDQSCQSSERPMGLFFPFLFLILFVGLYSLTMTVTRYSFPIAPLFIAIIAFAVNEIFFKKFPSA